MYCQKCGALNDENAFRCVKCNEIVQVAAFQTSVPPPAQTVPDLLVWSILATLLCCLPLGIPAIVYAVQANSKAKEGNYATGMELANKAKTWCWVSFGCGLLVGLVAFVFGFLGAAVNH